MWPGMMFGGFGTMFVWPILLIVGVIAFAFWTQGKAPFSSQSNDSALDVLKKRYAKGEISKKEFESMKKDIQ